MKFKNYEVDILSRKLLEEISSAQKAPCLSLYQFTHRHHPENLQDSIRFSGLVKELETSLLLQYSAEETQILLNPFEALTIDAQFWNQALDGLAVFASPNFFRVVRLPHIVSNLSIVADSFHTKPLIRFLQTVDRYQVLGVSLHHIRLFEGNRNSLEEIELVPEVPRTISEALGDKFTLAHTSVASYGGVGARSVPMRHGHGGKKDEVDTDQERYFRAVDRAIWEYYSKHSGLPLILAALPEHHYLFQKISHNSSLIAEGIEFNPDSLSIAQLRKLAWKAIRPNYESKLEAWREEFTNAHSEKIGSDDLVQVAQAAASGRVKTLLIESGRQIAGRLDAVTGRVELDDLRNPEVDDLLDDLGELVEKMKGQVQVVHSDWMPSKTGLAAIYRY